MNPNIWSLRWICWILWGSSRSRAGCQTVQCILFTFGSQQSMASNDIHNWAVKNWHLSHSFIGILVQIWLTEKFKPQKSNYQVPLNSDTKANCRTNLEYPGKKWTTEQRRSSVKMIESILSVRIAQVDAWIAWRTNLFSELATIVFPYQSFGHVGKRLRCLSETGHCGSHGPNYDSVKLKFRLLWRF